MTTLVIKEIFFSTAAFIMANGLEICEIGMSINIEISILTVFFRYII